MDIETGDSPPICQRPLRHAEWVKHELNILEDARVIVCNVSPWASPIVVIQRLCVNYWALNKLLPPLQKAFSNAKGVLSLAPLPKIDDIYVRLKGARVFSALDFQSGYHHMELTAEARPKTAFTLPANL